MVFAAAGVMAYTPPITNRVDIDFNTGWKYYQGDASGAQATTFGDGAWESVCLPHTTKFITPSATSAYIGISWYRKHFTVDNSYQGRDIYIQFGAAMQAADVYVNGTQVGAQHTGGYMEFTLDITAAVTFGADNVIAVRTNSAANANWAPGKSGVDFQYHGGLYREALMYTTDKLHVTDAVLANKTAGGGIDVTYSSVSSGSATVNIKTDVSNENSSAKSYTVLSEIVDAQGNLVQSATSSLSINANAASVASQSITVSSPHLWHPNTPYLYTLHTTIKDGVNPVDYYKTRIGIRSIQWTRTSGILINGSTFRAQGINVHQDIYGLGNAIPKRAIYYDVKRMKEAGIQYIRCCHYPHSTAFYDACDEFGILIENCITGWQNYVNSTAFNNSTYQETHDLIHRDRNHACVAVWETQLNESAYPSSWATTVNNLAHQEGSQIMTCGTVADGGWGSMGISSNTPWDVGLGASQHNVRANTASQPVVIGEYGDWDFGGGSSTSRVAREGSESALLVQVGNIQQSLNNNRALSWLSADAYWDYGDYSGGGSAVLCGIMDMYRIPKPSYFFFQSQRDPAVILPNAGSGPMVYIANRWTSGSPTTVKVFSNCQQVSLYRNNTLVETRSPDNDANSTHLLHPPFTFSNVTFASGELKAVGLNGGVQAATFSRNTPQTAAAVKLRPENDTIVADGSDARLIWIDVVDANGTVVPDNTASVTVSVSGGSIIGPATLTMKGGQLAIWVRGTPASSQITVTATSGSLTTGTCTLNAAATVGVCRPAAMEAANQPKKMQRSVTFFAAGDRINLPQEVMTGRISIFDISGRLIARFPVESRAVDLVKISRMSSGIHAIKIEQSTGGK
jgi:hypothetical protein